jgi:uncharacterized membrane protein
MKSVTWWRERYAFTGTALGLIFLWLSFTPSLLPRGPLFQSLVGAGSAAIGYGLGVFAVFLVRFMRSKDSAPPAPLRAWLILAVVGVLGTVWMNFEFAGWQHQIRGLVGASQLHFIDYLQIAVLSLVIWYVLVEIAKLFRWALLWITHRLERFAPPRVSAVVALAVVLVLVVTLVNGVLVRSVMGVINTTFSKVNNEEHASVQRPTSALRSGGDGSSVSWDSLGNQGRNFVSAGPSVAQLTEFNGTPAIEPIRVYAGLGSAHGLQAIADDAAAELVRTGGLKRKVVAVATTTGTGWINQAEATSLEYMYNGDTAIVSMQYSFLPSWISFLVDKENARTAGQLLFEAVDAKIRALPEGQRPKLVVFGESLGSFGGEYPFHAPNNLLARTDGALFSGPTFDNSVWTNVVMNRDPGSPQWLPVYDGGANIRFVARPSDLDRGGKPWGAPRAVYLQHASDPIGHWSPNLIFTKPDWLREKRGNDVLPSMRWIPFVTFLQVAADMAVAVDVPDGHGHVYVRDVANAWAAILQPPGWTPEKTEKLRPLLRQNA